MEGHLFQNYDRISVRFFVTYYCDLSYFSPSMGCLPQGCVYFLLIRPFHVNVRSTNGHIHIYIYIYIYNSFLEKGCPKKCTRQTWKVLWMILSALFFKEKFERMALEATDICLRVLKGGNKSRCQSRLSLIVLFWIGLLFWTVTDVSTTSCGSHLQSQSELYHVCWWYYTLVIDLIGQLRRDVIGRLSGKPCSYSFKIFPWFITSYWWPNIEEFCG